MRDRELGKMNVVLDDRIEDQFRRAVFQRKGMKKGNISAALEEAIKHWIETYKEEPKGK